MVEGRPRRACAHIAQRGWRGSARGRRSGTERAARSSDRRCRYRNHGVARRSPTRRAKADGIKSVPTGIDHGTVTLVVDGHAFEVTTLREDTETFPAQRRRSHWAATGCATRSGATSPSTVCRSMRTGAFTTTWAALKTSPRPTNPLHWRTRTRELPSTTCASCVLRIHAAYGAGEVDRAGYLACIGGRDGLANSSAERIRVEILKLMVAGGAVVAAQCHGGRRAVAADLRRPGLNWAVCGPDFDRARAGPVARSNPPSGRACGCRHRGCPYASPRACA